MARPNEAVPRIRSTPGAPATADSIGVKIRRSISSGARPSPSVKIATVGLFILGNTSTFIVSKLKIPSTAIRAETTIVVHL